MKESAERFRQVFVTEVISAELSLHCALLAKDSYADINLVLLFLKCITSAEVASNCHQILLVTIQVTIITFICEQTGHALMSIGHSGSFICPILSDRLAFRKQ